MREQPWNIRRATHRHLHDYENLRDLHGLTQAWLTSATQAGAKNPFDQEPTLEDDTSPEDVLARLERQVQATQLKVIQTLAQAQEALTLDLVSFGAGKICAEKRWTVLPSDKRALLVALYHSPLSQGLSAGAFLVRRMLTSEVSIELLCCPHRAKNSTAEQAAVDLLCKQQFHWLKGYFSHLAPDIDSQITTAHGRCVVSW